MRWTIFVLAGALSLSSVSASETPVLKAKFDLDLLSQHTASQPYVIDNATTPNLFSRFLRHFDLRQEAGRCGASAGGARCPNNQCCSTFDYCGTDPEHCGVIVGCQPQYGRCGDAAPEPTPTPTPSPTPSPTPTPTPTPTPSASPSPSTSSTSVVVPPSSSSVLPPLPSGTLIVSPNGQCGNVTTCAGSAFGSCCSEFYFCGSGALYCGTGCHSAFGTCGSLPPGSSSVPAPVPSTSSVVVPIPSSSSTRPTTTPTPTPTPSLTPTATPTPAPPVPTNSTTDGRCGAEGNGKTCSGSTFGRCCSDYGWCGSSDDFCRPAYGCRPDFGTCG